MKITFLGTGTSVGVPQLCCKCPVCISEDWHDKRLRSSILIEVKGRNILIDCGPDFRIQMLRYDVTHLESVLLTHSHYDHIAGLDDLRPYTVGRDFPIYIEQRVDQAIRQMMPYAFGDNRYPGVPTIIPHIIEPDRSFTLFDIEVTPIRVMHAKLPILGFRIENFAYMTDVSNLPDDQLDKLSGIDTLVVSALRFDPHMSHQSLPEALALISKIAPRRAFLTHLSHQIGFHAQLPNYLPDNVSPAYDGLVLNMD